MASRTSRTPLAATFYIAAGLVLLVAVLASFVAFVGSFFSWAFIVFALALGIALGLLASTSRHRIVRPALYVAAVGWVIVAIESATGILGPAALLVTLLAAAGGVVASIIIFRAGLLPRRSSIGFLVAMILAALYLLGLAQLTSLALGVSLLVTGILLRQGD